MSQDVEFLDDPITVTFPFGDFKELEGKVLDGKQLPTRYNYCVNKEGFGEGRDAEKFWIKASALLHMTLQAAGVCRGATMTIRNRTNPEDKKKKYWEVTSPDGVVTDSREISRKAQPAQATTSRGPLTFAGIGWMARKSYLLARAITPEDPEAAVRMVGVIMVAADRAGIRPSDEDIQGFLAFLKGDPPPPRPATTEPRDDELDPIGAEEWAELVGDAMAGNIPVVEFENRVREMMCEYLKTKALPKTWTFAKVPKGLVKGIITWVAQHQRAGAPEPEPGGGAAKPYDDDLPF